MRFNLCRPRARIIGAILMASGRVPKNSDDAHRLFARGRDEKCVRDAIRKE